jgi:hypothetical protein
VRVAVAVMPVSSRSAASVIAAAAFARGRSHGLDLQDSMLVFTQGVKMIKQ